MARPKETPVPVPGQGNHVPTASQLSQERVSASSSSDSESASSDSHSDSDESDRSDGGSLRGGPDTDMGRQATTTVYRPPQGFQSLKTDPSSSHASKLFSPSNLAGKQIWHITAPASVPLSSLKEVSIQKVMNCEAVLSHDGSDYGFLSVGGLTAGSNQTTLLVPGKESYQLAGINFAQTLLLQQLIRLPLHTSKLANTDGALQSSHALPAAEKVAREQPEGLKMRFTPIGVDSSRSVGVEWGSSDSPDVEGPGVSGKDTGGNSFPLLNGFTKGHIPNKRKRESLDAELSPRKKQSKHKVDHKLHPIAGAPIDPTTPQKSNISSRPTPTQSSSIPAHDSSGRRRETSRERARRKEKEQRSRDKAQDNGEHRHRHRRNKEKSSALDQGVKAA